MAPLPLAVTGVGRQLRAARADGTAVGRNINLAVSALREDRAREQLAQQLRADETVWLDADLG